MGPVARPAPVPPRGVGVVQAERRRRQTPRAARRHVPRVGPQVVAAPMPVQEAGRLAANAGDVASAVARTLPPLLFGAAAGPPLDAGAAMPGLTRVGLPLAVGVGPVQGGGIVLATPDRRERQTDAGYALWPGCGAQGTAASAAGHARHGRRPQPVGAGPLGRGVHRHVGAARRPPAAVERAGVAAPRVGLLEQTVEGGARGAPPRRF